MGAINLHIDQIKRDRGWEHIRIQEVIWSSDKWTLAPNRLTIAKDYLIVEFHVFYDVSTIPDGQWVFNPQTNSEIFYDKSNCNHGSAGAGTSTMTSHRITRHKGDLVFKPHTVAPPSYKAWLRIIILEEGI